MLETLLDNLRVLTVAVLHHPLSSSLALVTAWFLCVAIYRVFLHPLAKYPGPLLAKVTDFYNVYHCLKGDRHIEFHRIHQKYGGMVRYGPNRVSICTTEALHAIYSPTANVQKSSHFRVFLKFFPTPSSQNIIDTVSHNHKAKRKVLIQALTDTSLRIMEVDLLKSIRKFCSLLVDQETGSTETSGSKWSAPRDMATLSSYLSFDIMGRVCFGRSFNMLENDEHRHILDVIGDGAKCLNTAGHMQSLLRTGLHKILFSKLLVGLQNYKDYSAAQCHNRLNSKLGTQYNDVFSHIQSATHPDTGRPVFTSQEMISESSLLIIAGSDTTSTCIAATLFYLLHNPTTLQRAKDEVRTTFPTLESIHNTPSLSTCTYLRACIDESLRLSPPVGGLMPREVKAGGISINGHAFPEGAELGTPHYAIHHDPRYYSAPFTFDPTRWLTDDKEALLAARSAFCAWSVGSRSCVGKAMAYMQMTVVLGRLLWEFEMRLAEGSNLGDGGDMYREEGRRRKGEYQLWDTFASKNYGPMVEFKSREV